MMFSGLVGVKSLIIEHSPMKNCPRIHREFVLLGLRFVSPYPTWHSQDTGSELLLHIQGGPGRRYKTEKRGNHLHTDDTSP